MLGNYPITPTRAPADTRDASHPARIWRAPRGARRSDGGMAVSRTPPGEPCHHRRCAQDCTACADCLALRGRRPQPKMECAATAVGLP